MPDSNPDYVTLLPALSRTGHYYCVVVRKYHAPDDDYINTRVSRPLKEVAAKALAQSWANALGVEIR